jgi:hypothetical protein
MIDMSEALEQYLALRRSLGFKLSSQESRLRNFVRYAEGAWRSADHREDCRGLGRPPMRPRDMVVAPVDREGIRPPRSGGRPPDRGSAFAHLSRRSEDRVLSSTQTNRSPISLKAMLDLHPGSFRGTDISLLLRFARFHRTAIFRGGSPASRGRRSGCGHVNDPRDEVR